MAICISPRPSTSKIFGSAVCLMRNATFVRISFCSRSQMCRAVTSLPSWPASGLSFTANSDLKNFRIGGLLDAQRDVRADFLLQPLPNVPRSDELAVLAGERAVVHGKFRSQKFSDRRSA